MLNGVGTSDIMHHLGHIAAHAAIAGEAPSGVKNRLATHLKILMRAIRLDATVNKIQKGAARRHIGLEYRALPFAWNRAGFDSRGKGNDGKFPDLKIDSQDQTFRFNQMISLSLGFFPQKRASSE